MIVKPNRKFVIKDVEMSRDFINWVQEITDCVNMAHPLSGVGSPENVIAADAGKFYFDTTGGSGSVLYIKQVDDIAGNRTQGWVLV